MSLDDERSEWLDWRRGGIGASDVAALCGMSPWASPMSVWADKRGLSTDEDSDVMEFGRRAEPMLTGYFQDRTGFGVRGQQDRCAHPDNPHHLCTLDGWVFESPAAVGEPLGIVEYKTTGRGAWDEIPDNYAVQVQWQLHVTGQQHAWMGVLHDRTFRTYPVERDERSIAVLVDVVDRFWTDHVLTGNPPPADAHRATSKALADAYPEPTPGVAADLDDVLWALDLREQAKAAISDAKFDMAKAENAIKAALGDAEVGRIKGEPIISWKQTTRKGHTVAASTFRQLRTLGAK